MGPLVTQRLLLMKEWGLLMKPDELFGLEGWALASSRRLLRPREERMPYGVSIWEARAEVTDPSYAAKCKQATGGEPPPQKQLGRTQQARDFRLKVATEAKADRDAAKQGKKEAAVAAVAAKHGVDNRTLLHWIVKYLTGRRAPAFAAE